MPVSPQVLWLLLHFNPHLGIVYKQEFCEGRGTVLNEWCLDILRYCLLEDYMIPANHYLNWLAGILYVSNS